MHTILIAFRIAGRNLKRNKKRTLLSAIGLSVGLMVMIFALGMINGGTDQAIDNMISYEIAHIKGYPVGYLDDEIPSLDYRIENANQIVEEINADPRFNATSRLHVTARVIVDREETFMKLVGVDPKTDLNVYKTLDALSLGRSLKSDNTNSVLMGELMARDLNVVPGDVIRILVRSAPGALNSLQVRVVGILNSGHPLVDRTSLIMKLSELQNLILTPDFVNEISITLTNGRKTKKVAKEIIHKYPQLVWEEWIDAAEYFLKLMRVRRIIFSVVIAIMALMAAVAVSNTMIMAVHERTQEIGALRALGFQSRTIAGIFLFEGALIGVISGIIAIIIGGSCVVWLSHHGIHFQELDDYDTGMPLRSVIYPSTNIVSLSSTFLFGIIMTTLASWNAARKASTGEVVKALREGML
jgi:lipoprotein-releasing system permease protein